MKNETAQKLFFAMLLGAGLPLPTTEHKFHSTRRWRFDYAWIDYKLALEVEGGVWTGGRHTTGAGFVKDMEKYNEAARCGWIVIRCMPKTLVTAHTIAMINDIFNGGEGYE